MACEPKSAVRRPAIIDEEKVIMPPWLYNTLTVLSPFEGTLLATFGAVAFFVMLASENVRIKYGAAAIYSVGAFGLANAVVGALF